MANSTPVRGMPVWMDAKNYKNCRKKSYEIFMCIPPIGTIVVNKLEQYDIVKQLGGKTYFTAEEVKELQSKRPDVFSFLQNCVQTGKVYYVGDNQTVVLSGTCGEMWTTKLDKVAKTYTFIENGQQVSINPTSLQKKLKSGLLDWSRIRTIANNSQTMAVFVPVHQKGQVQTSWGSVLNFNNQGVSHGKGDFIVCSKLPDGKPNLNDKWVVNGEIFATTYDNHGWTDCLKQSGIKNITITSLPNLVPQQAVNNDKGVDANVFKQKCDTLMKELQKVYKFNIASNEYGTVDNCIGFSKSKCYTARYIVKGNFNYKYGSLDEPSSSTLIWFVCDATHSDSALGMVFERDEIVNTHCKDITTKGIVFIELPHNNTGVNTTYGYKNCRTGSISDINCAEEVQSFKLRHKGTADTFIDNRKPKSLEDLKYIFNSYKSAVSEKLIEFKRFIESFHCGVKYDFSFDLSQVDDYKRIVQEVLANKDKIDAGDSDVWDYYAGLYQNNISYSGVCAKFTINSVMSSSSNSIKSSVNFYFFVLENPRNDNYKYIVLNYSKDIRFINFDYIYAINKMPSNFKPSYFIQAPLTKASRILCNYNKVLPALGSDNISYRISCNITRVIDSYSLAKEDFSVEVEKVGDNEWDFSKADSNLVRSAINNRLYSLNVDESDLIPYLGDSVYRRHLDKADPLKSITHLPNLGTYRVEVKDKNSYLASSLVRIYYTKVIEAPTRLESGFDCRNDLAYKLYESNKPISELIGSQEVINHVDDSCICLFAIVIPDEESNKCGIFADSKKLFSCFKVSLDTLIKGNKLPVENAWGITSKESNSRYNLSVVSPLTNVAELYCDGFKTRYKEQLLKIEMYDKEVLQTLSDVFLRLNHIISKDSSVSNVDTRKGSLRRAFKDIFAEHEGWTTLPDLDVDYIRNNTELRNLVCEYCQGMLIGIGMLEYFRDISSRHKALDNFINWLTLLELRNGSGFEYGRDQGYYRFKLVPKNGFYWCQILGDGFSIKKFDVSGDYKSFKYDTNTCLEILDTCSKLNKQYNNRTCDFKSLPTYHCHTLSVKLKDLLDEFFSSIELKFSRISLNYMISYLCDLFDWNGINVLDKKLSISGDDSDTSYSPSIVIDGDNDGYLRLSFKYEVGDDKLSKIRIRGKSNNKVLDTTINYMVLSPDDTRTGLPEPIFKAYSEICKVLGVNPFRVFFKPSYLRGLINTYGAKIRFSSTDASDDLKSCFEIKDESGITTVVITSEFEYNTHTNGNSPKEVTINVRLTNNKVKKLSYNIRDYGSIHLMMIDAIKGVFTIITTLQASYFDSLRYIFSDSLFNIGDRDKTNLRIEERVLACKGSDGAISINLSKDSSLIKIQSSKLAEPKIFQNECGSIAFKNGELYDFVYKNIVYGINVNTGLIDPELCGGSSDSKPVKNTSLVTMCRLAKNKPKLLTSENTLDVNDIILKLHNHFNGGLTNFILTGIDDKTLRLDFDCKGNDSVFPAVELKFNNENKLSGHVCYVNSVNGNYSDMALSNDLSTLVPSVEELLSGFGVSF